MSYFSTALKVILESAGESRAAFAARIGMPTSTLHQYVHGRFSPDADILEKICQILTDSERVELVIAHLKDEIPPSAADFIRIVNLMESSVVAEVAEGSFGEVKLPSDLKRDFQFLERMAVEHPDTAEWVQSTVRMFRGN